MQLKPMWRLHLTKLEMMCPRPLAMEWELMEVVFGYHLMH
jgi:hypothetical protein